MFDTEKQQDTIKTNAIQHFNRGKHQKPTTKHGKKYRTKTMPDNDKQRKQAKANETGTLTSENPKNQQK